MSSGYDRYDLHRLIKLSAVERIIYMSKTDKAKEVRDALLSGGNLSKTEELLVLTHSVLSRMKALLIEMGGLAMDVRDDPLNQLQINEKNEDYMLLFDEFNNYRNSRYNGRKVFQDSFSSGKQQFLDSLSNGWIKAAEVLAKSAYGWTVNKADDWGLVVNEKDTGGYAAFVKTENYGDGTSNVIEMQFDLPDFTEPYTQPLSVADRVVAHELVHIMHAQNSYYGDLIGDGTMGVNWFKEGLAEFVHGADSRVLSILGNNPSDAKIDTLLSAIETGNESWSSMNQYVAGYLAVKFLHKLIIDSGHEDGVRHMTLWMKEQFDNDEGSANSGINAYFKAFNIAKSDPLKTPLLTNDDFLTHFKDGVGSEWVKKLLTDGSFGNEDTGSILGGEHLGSKELNQFDVVPNASGPPESTYTTKESEDNVAVAVLPDGTPLALPFLNEIIFGDSDYYNIANKASVTLVLERLEVLKTAVSTSQALTQAAILQVENSEGNNSSGQEIYFDGIIGNRVAGTQFENAVVLEKRHFLSDNTTPAGHQYSDPSVAGGSELWLDGIKIWPHYREIRSRIGAFCYPWWQGIQSFGYSIALADETITNTIAVGAPGDSNGSAGVYTFSMEDKNLSPIGYGGLQASGFSPGDSFGESVAVSYDGTVVAVGATQHSRNYCKSQSGYVVVRHLIDQEVEIIKKRIGFAGPRFKRYKSIEKKWVNKGQVIGGGAYDRAGYRVKLSKDGNTLAVSRVHSHQGSCSRKNYHKGSVEVYSYNATTEEWDQKGSTMWGNEKYEGFGIGLDMTPDGECIVVGSPYFRCPWGVRIGRAQVFKYNGGDWKKVGRSLTPSNYNMKATPQEEESQFLHEHTHTTGIKAGATDDSQKTMYADGKWGKSVSISGDGRIVAIGAPNVKPGARAVSVFEWDRATANDYTNNAWSGHSSINQITNKSGYEVALNDAGNILAWSIPGSDAPWGSEWATGAGKIRVASWGGSSWINTAASLDYKAYGPGAGSLLSRLALSPSGRYVGMGTPIAPDRADPDWDFMVPKSSTAFGAARVCDLTELVKNLDLPTGQQSIEFSNLMTLSDADTEYEANCTGAGGGDEDEDEPYEEESGSDGEKTEESEDPEQENPKKDSVGSPPKNVGEPQIVAIDNGDGTTTKKQVYVTEEKEIVYVTEYINPDDCECEISAGKKNNTIVQQVYTPPDDGVLIKKNGDVEAIKKGVQVNVPPGGTTFTRKPPGKKRVIEGNRWDCPFVENWNPVTHYDCKFYDPNRGSAADILGRKTDGGTFNSSKTNIQQVATKKGFVTKSQTDPTDKTVRIEKFEPGDNITVGPGETVFQEGGANDDAGYNGGAYTTDTGERVAPSNILKEHDSGIVNNTTEIVVIQRELSCEEYCKCVKVKNDGTIEEIDIRENDITLESGETLIRGEEKETLGVDPSQQEVGYEGGTYTNDSGRELDPSELTNDETGTPFLSEPGSGTKNTSTEDTEYIPLNNVVLLKENGDVQKIKVDSGEGTSSITLKPGDTIFEDNRPPQDEGTFQSIITDGVINSPAGDIDVGNFISGSGGKTLITNHEVGDSDVSVPPGHTGLIIGVDGEVGIIEGGSAGKDIKLKPGESITYGKDLPGVGGGGYTEGTGDGGIQNEEDVGFVPIDKLLSGGNQGIKNKGDEDLSINVPAGKKATIIGPNNEIKIVDGPIDYPLPPNHTINIGDDNGFDDAGYTSGEFGGNDISELIDDPDSGVTNNTLEPICIPIATKEIETEDGTEVLLEPDPADNTKLLLGQARNLVMKLMRSFGGSMKFSNPTSGIFRAKNPYTTISKPRTADDCEPGYEKLQPGETMFRGKSNGVEDAEYTGGAFTDPNNTEISNSTDISSIIANPTSGLTNSSGQDKQVNLPEGYSGAIIGSGRRMKLLNGGLNKKIILGDGESLIMGQNAGVSDAEYTGSGNVSGAGTNISSFVTNPSSGISNTSGSNKSIQLGTGNPGLLLNPLTKEVILVSGGNAVIPSGFNLYEGTGLKISNAEIVPSNPFEGHKMSSIFDDDSQTSGGIKNTSSEDITMFVPAGKKAFHITTESIHGPYNFPEGGSTVTLKPGETLVTGNELKEYTITLETIDNMAMMLYGTQYDSSKTIPGSTATAWWSKTEGENIKLKSNETFAIMISDHKIYSDNNSYGYELDFIKANSLEIQEIIEQSILHSLSSLVANGETNITITAASKLKTSHKVTLGGNASAEKGSISFSWPNGEFVNGSFSNSSGTGSSDTGFSEKTFMEGTVISYTVQPKTSWALGSMTVGSNGPSTALSGNFTVNQDITVGPNFASELVSLTYELTDYTQDGQARISYPSNTFFRWDTNKEYVTNAGNIGMSGSPAISDPSDQYTPGTLSHDFKFKAGTQVTIDLDHILRFDRTIDKLLINGIEQTFTIDSTFNLTLDGDKEIKIRYKKKTPVGTYTKINLDILEFSGDIISQSIRVSYKGVNYYPTTQGTEIVCTNADSDLVFVYIRQYDDVPHERYDDIQTSLRVPSVAVPQNNSSGDPQYIKAVNGGLFAVSQVDEDTIDGFFRFPGSTVWNPRKIGTQYAYSFSPSVLTSGDTIYPLLEILEDPTYWEYWL